MYFTNMNIKTHRLRAAVALKTVWYNDPPEICLKFMDDVIYQGELRCDFVFSIDKKMPEGPGWITVDLLNKLPTDTCAKTGQDKAVVVDNIVFNDISSPKFVWEGLYTPQYHNDWYQQQVANGNTPDRVLKYHNYLGWNGQWRLDFSIPIFTWIPHLEDLGWIYD